MSRSASDVSIITVNWNGEKHLRSLLPSLTQLTPREIIVVDNGSTDSSVAYLKQHYPQVRVLENRTNRGFCQPNNLAAGTAKGDVLAFINNDMRAGQDWLEAGLLKMSSSPCVASRILDWEGKRADFNGSSLQYLGYALQQDIGKLVSELSHKDKILFPCGGAMLIDRSLFLESGGFDEDFFAVYEDVDLGWRLWVLGHEVTLAPESVVYHRGHATFQTQRTEKLRYLMHRNAFLTILKNYEDPQLSKILPMALIMGIKRAVRCSGVSKESFYLWRNVRSRLENNDQSAYSEILDSLNHLVALEDALELLPKMVDKRRDIQIKRRRRDTEILNLFRDPLRAIVEDHDYISQEIDYLHHLNLDKLFDTEGYNTRRENVPDRLPDRLHSLRSELKGIQWTGSYGLQNPSPRPPGKLRGLYSTWQISGLSGVMQLIKKRFRRGI